MGPTGGTFQLHMRHVTSGPIPYNATAAQISDIYAAMGALDEQITAAHTLAKHLFPDCEVCFPRPVSAPRAKRGVAYRTRRWIARLPRRIAGLRSSHYRY